MLCGIEQKSIIAFHEGISKEFGLTVVGFPRICRVFHQGDLLGDETSDVQYMRLLLPRLSFVQRVVSVDVDDCPFCHAFRSVLPQVIQAASNSGVSELEPFDHRVG